MANIRDLKKDINYVLGDIIEAVYIWELTHPSKDDKKAESIIDEAISTFDELILKVNDKKVGNKKQHFKPTRHQTLPAPSLLPLLFSQHYRQSIGTKLLDKLRLIFYHTKRFTQSTKR